MDRAEALLYCFGDKLPDGVRWNTYAQRELASMIAAAIQEAVNTYTGEAERYALERERQQLAAIKRGVRR